MSGGSPNQVFAVEIMYNVSAFEHFIKAYFWHLGWNMAHNECVRAPMGWAYKGEHHRMGYKIGYNDLYSDINLNGLRTYLNFIMYMIPRITFEVWEATFY